MSVTVYVWCKVIYLWCKMLILVVLDGENSFFHSWLLNRSLLQTNLNNRKHKIWRSKIKFCVMVLFEPQLYWYGLCWLSREVFIYFLFVLKNCFYFSWVGHVYYNYCCIHNANVTRAMCKLAIWTHEQPVLYPIIFQDFQKSALS